ncbi:MAG: SDR family oxidoreductase [Bacteroidetes bacterium]|nr:SDR family oxidoreductase [Bacteroidota bacterium]MCY4233726.1 SDR family oxidoreductase [Bacteroidota bacterium]
MDLGLEGRTAFITGASSGLGLAAAVALAQEGCNVTICSRDSGRIQAASETILNNEWADPNKILPLVCDVTQESQIQSAITKSTAKFGHLHILLTNAGGPKTGQIDDFSEQDWRDGLELNLVSTINLCRHALPHLRSAAENDGHARILMLTSIAAKQPINSLYLSNTSRAGVQGFAKTLSEELGQHGITVNTLLPGFTRTERLQHLVDYLVTQENKTKEQVEEGWAKQAALNRLGEPWEFAAAATFLASKQAGFITGVALAIDGGYSKHIL